MRQVVDVIIVSELRALMNTGLLQPCTETVSKLI